jgi:hypothetical protein
MRRFLELVCFPQSPTLVAFTRSARAVCRPGGRPLVEWTMFKPVKRQPGQRYSAPGSQVPVQSFILGFRQREAVPRDDDEC